jgi:hypothetical protein
MCLNVLTRVCSEKREVRTEKSSIKSVIPEEENVSAHEKDSRSSATSSIETELKLDPYTTSNRRLMMHDKRIYECLQKFKEEVIFHSRNIPLLPLSQPYKQRFKKCVTLKLEKFQPVEVVGLLGAGAFASVYSVKMHEKNADSSHNYAMKVHTCISNSLSLYVLTWSS